MASFNQATKQGLDDEQLAPAGNLFPFPLQRFVIPVCGQAMVCLNPGSN